MRHGMVTAILVVSMVAGSSAWAAETEKGERQIPLKDGSTLVVFKDGKMAMRDSKGRPLSMKESHPMETKDGKIIMMRGNEIWRKTQSEKELEDLYRGG
jgi:hypothetical protein